MVYALLLGFDLKPSREVLQVVRVDAGGVELPLSTWAAY